MFKIGLVSIQNSQNGPQHKNRNKKITQFKLYCAVNIYSLVRSALLPMDLVFTDACWKLTAVLPYSPWPDHIVVNSPTCSKWEQIPDAVDWKTPDVHHTVGPPAMKSLLLQNDRSWGKETTLIWVSQDWPDTGSPALKQMVTRSRSGHDLARQPKPGWQTEVLTSASDVIRVVAYNFIATSSGDVTDMSSHKRICISSTQAVESAEAGQGCWLD